MENCEPRLYAALISSNKFVDNSDTKNIVALEDEARSLRQRAQAIWDSIPVGDLIQVNAGPVGENAEVQRLKAQAEKVESRAADAKKQFTNKYAASLDGTEWSEAWDEHEAIITEIRHVKDQNRWYYRSPLRFILKGLGVIACIVMLLSVAPFWIGVRIFLFGDSTRPRIVRTL